MTRDEASKQSPAFRAGYSDGLTNAPIRAIPQLPRGHVYGREDISEYWWGYHVGRRERVAEQKRLIP